MYRPAKSKKVTVLILRVFTKCHVCKWVRLDTAYFVEIEN